MKLKFIIIFFVISQILACSSSTKKTAEDSLLTEVKAPAKKQPLMVSVSQAFYVSDKLNVKVLLEANTNYPSNKIAIKLSALKQGEVVEEQLKLVSDLFEDSEIKAEQRLIIPFEVESTDFNEYQIYCSWGADAQILTQEQSKDRNFAKNSKTSETKVVANAIQDIKLERVELIEKNKDCTAKSTQTNNSAACPLHYSISAALVNQSASAAINIKLAVGILWAETGKLPQIVKDLEAARESEELLDLDDYILKAFSEKKIKVDIDREVPIHGEGKFFPYIRIVEFNTKKD